MRAATAMMMLVAAAAGASTFPAAIALRDDAFLRAYRATVITRDVRIPRCAAIDALEGALAYATIDVNAHVPFPGVDRQGRYYGRTVFAIRHVTLRLPRTIEWPRMTQADRLGVREALAALRHHEIGHVRVAAAEVARLNASPRTITPDAEAYRQTEMRRQDAGLAAVAAAQRAYDRLTDHGRSQQRARGASYGPAAELRCAAASSGQEQ
jgi:hypothetical protein